MKSNYSYKKLCIDIVTYRTDYKNIQSNKNMNAHETHDKNQQKFICSICLNQNQNCLDDNSLLELMERKSRSCPVCHHSYIPYDGDSTVSKGSQSNNTVINEKIPTKNVQTSQPDVTQGLSLLNEVLNVFQSKKHSNNRKESRRTLIFKDVGVSTEERFARKKRNLTMSKVFQWSIDDTCRNENKFTIISSSQPDTIFEARKSVDLIKHKSSSIPQMKLEQLKKSLKGNTNSKDAMEEANRIFATMKRENDEESVNNRPMVRNGPRVLPVVKTGKFIDADENKKCGKNSQKCKCCLENNIHMSGGDSSEKSKCCHTCKRYFDKCDDCVNIMCCHYKQSKETRETMCKRCRAVKTETECNR